MDAPVAVFRSGSRLCACPPLRKISARADAFGRVPMMWRLACNVPIREGSRSMPTVERPGGEAYGLACVTPRSRLGTARERLAQSPHAVAHRADVRGGSRHPCGCAPGRSQASWPDTACTEIPALCDGLGGLLRVAPDFPVPSLDRLSQAGCRRLHAARSHDTTANFWRVGTGDCPGPGSGNACVRAIADDRGVSPPCSDFYR